MAAGQNPTDGIRRYEELVAEAKQIANTALAIAMTGSVLNTSGVLDIPHGGTGANRKVFVDTYSNQFNIHGSKTFHDSCAFQKETDVVDSQELAGNVRLVTCDPQGADIGPQMRFSGRNTDNDLTVFAFGTLAGRKFNSVSGDKSGYLQFAVTNAAGVIAEAMRINHQYNLRLGTIAVDDGCDRLQISGGNILLDYEDSNISCPVAPSGREFHIQVGNGSASDVRARFQALADWYPTAPAKHLFLSINSRLQQSGICSIDDANIASAGIEVFADDVSGMINFYTAPAGNPACVCPSLRGFFHDGGFDVLGDIIATASSQPCGTSQGNVIAGGARNYPNAAVDSVGRRGNNNSSKPGMVVGDNLHFGTGDPEGVVNAPTGAIYGRNDPTTDTEVLYAKTGDDYGPTLWKPIPVGAQGATVCVDGGCPDPTKCPIWFDTVTKMLWYWEPNAKPGQPVPGAWLSSQIFHAIRNIPGDDGADTVAFRGKTNKKYDYLMPTHLGRNLRHPSLRFDLYFSDLIASWRVQDNSADYPSDKNYYLMDMITIMSRQGTPYGGLAKGEWAGNRDPEDSKGYQIKGIGHTYHPNLPTNLVTRALPDANVVQRWVGTVTSADSKTKLYFDPTQLKGYDVNGNLICGPGCPYAANMWNAQLNRATLPFNDGYIIHWLTTAVIFNQDQSRWITDSGSDYIKWRMNQHDIPSPGDTFEIMSSQYRRVIGRLSTKNNLWFSKGPYNNDITDDLNDFVLTGSYATTFQSNYSGGYSYPNPVPQDPVTYTPQWLDTNYLQLPLDYYLPLVDDATAQQKALDAQVVALLWDSVGSPGKLAASVNVSYRLAMPPLNGNPC